MEKFLYGGQFINRETGKKLFCTRKQWKFPAQHLVFTVVPSLNRGPQKKSFLWQRCRAGEQSRVNLGPGRIAEVKLGLLEQLEGNDTEAGNSTKC